MKDVKLGVLDEIKKMMGDRMAAKIGKPKEVSVEVSAMSPKEGMEEPEQGESMQHENGESKPMEMSEQSGELDQSKLSPEELEQLKALYEKMC